MFERFSDDARRAIVLAEAAAKELRHPAIGTEHILLGVFRQGEESGRALDVLGVTADGLRDLVVQQAPVGDDESPEHVPFASQAKKVLLAAFTEASRAGHPEIVPPHLLLGVLTDTASAAYGALDAAGIDPVQLRERVLSSLPPPPPAALPGMSENLREMLEDWQRRLDPE